jgi:hypothetical protein
VLVILIIGGTGRLYGGFIGAIVFLLCAIGSPCSARSIGISGSGFLLVIVVAFFRRGIVPSVETLAQRLRRR